ncbi:MAG: hypothetical protein J6W41_02890 [Alphaproteobacteria bacterium]|nr:hypothetical protein [Alphaproteobacteria bacterium]
MQKKSQLLWSCVAGCAALVVMSGAGAAPRSMTAGTTTARMPTMPTMSINTIGTHAVSGVGTPTGTVNTGTNTGGNGGGVNPNPNPNPNPDPTPTDCEDGGVANSEFTVDDCMQSMLDCVQSGVLPNGLNDLFNEDLRNSIINGMGICASQVDYCIRNVRVDCRNVYDSSVDVWLDFNSRIVQPEYYNFVLRKTGLTPNQAENVCELLDKNTYGKSFAAVSASGNVTSEYNNKVGAYNEQNNGTLSKNQPQGPMVNNTNNGNLTGVDGERGHYARWDATNGVCKVRVAAYNKDNMITNKWLFGAIGDDKAAEVWRDAGSSFTCNKDLFDFSLLNDTKTTAVVGMGGGTLLGAGIGALTGDKAKNFDCNDADARRELYNVLQSEGLVSKLNQYLSSNNRVPVSGSEFDNKSCSAIKKLANKMVELQNAIDVCAPTTHECSITIADQTIKLDVCSANDKMSVSGDTITITKGGVSQTFSGVDNAEAANTVYQVCTLKCNPNTQCSFHSLKEIDIFDSMVCEGGQACMSMSASQDEVRDLKNVFANDKLNKVFQGTKSTVGKNALIGAGIGLGTGGVATAITAFVERNNISCRVGDGLDTVGFGKSYTIDSLKDFYVKWNLRVADSISPTARVTSCEDWIATCGMYTTPEDCNAVEINYQRPGRNTTTLVRSACRMSGSVCIENRSVARSYGACPRDGISPVVPPVGPVTPVNPGDVPAVIQH